MAKIYASTSDKLSERELKHAELTRWAATQGMVLLENDGTLPINVKDTPKVALYGAGARNTEKGGTGSGDVNQRFVVNIEEGFKKAGFEVSNQDWLGRYDALTEKLRSEWFAGIKKEAEEKHIPYWFLMFENHFRAPYGVEITEEDVKNSDTDTAFYIITRNSGEGADRTDTDGDYEIAKEEKEDMIFLTEHYKKVIVILNVSGTVDTKFYKEIPGLSALFLMSLAGTSSGDSLLEVLTGNVTPSGKLSMTWAKNYMDYPSSKTFSINDGDAVTEEYTEGIYVGYRYFDTFNVEPAYAFGFGGSYTTFDIKTLGVTADGENVCVKVCVTNTGKTYSGAEVVQIYVSKPEGNLEKPYQELLAFGKTKALAPGEAQELTISFPTSGLASYCENCASYVMEAGKYFVRVGNSSRNTHIVAAIELDKTAVTEKLKNILSPEKKINELSNKGACSYSYEGEENEKNSAVVIKLNADLIKTREVKYTEEREEIPAAANDGLKLTDVLAGKRSLDEFIGQLTVEEMAHLCVGMGHSIDGDGATSTIGAASSVVPGAAGDTSSLLVDSRDVANLALADGPAGLRLIQHFKTDKDDNMLPGQNAFGPQIESGEPDPEGTKHYYQYCTAIPIGTLLAQSWDYDVIYKMGELVGREMNEFGASVWLAPAMNIMRNPLCGRNFEYYSEDPVLAALCASADNDGVQSHPGIGTSVKHFAANNQEELRQGSDSVVTERALREIYLKAFELTVKASQPMTIMTSYNLLNGTHTANSFELITNAARDEWGFAGAVMTDWGTTSEMGFEFLRQAGIEMRPKGVPEGKEVPHCSQPELCIKAGNDWIMPGNMNDINR
ncbi:MAG: glycoside hydrolase family 3 C-terminal domain-containing protein, partial [Lachnospiraceae bacterium]|nr:glycoside hydrolase family 3 C-terminal domain-containing protein [Lachnospiraceae bacterium]